MPPKAKEREKSIVAARAMRQENLRTSGYFAGSQARIAHMLSYLSRDQLKKWNSYSPARQRRIIEEIEKKLERKAPGAPPANWQADKMEHFDISGYEDGEKPAGEYHIRGHPQETKIRTTQEMTARQNQMTLRGYASKKEGPAIEGGAGAAGKQSRAGRKGKVPRHGHVAAGKGLDAKKPEKRAGPRENALQAAKPPGVEKRSALPSETKRGGQIQNDVSGQPGYPARGRAKAVREAAQGKDRLFSDQGASRTRQAEEKRRAAVKGSPVRERMQELQKSSLKTGEGARPESLCRGGKPKEKRAAGTKQPHAPEGTPAQGMAKKHTGRKDEKPWLTLQKKKTQKEVLKGMGGGRFSRRKGPSPGKRSTKKADEKKAARYTKAFMSELIAVIGKDMAKDENISRAQKSGQINASIAELTGQTGRSAIRITTIPLKASLSILAKRLREEIKRKVRKAAAALIRYVATLGAPLFAIVIIVLLLSAICMIGTTQDSPRGTGLGFRIVQEAKKHLGLPYVYGGTSLVDGCDCSGFVWAIYNIFGYNLPRTAGDQYSYGRKVGSNVSDWQLGDLIYYSQTGTVQSGGGRAEHIVIYIGGGQVISCGPVAIYNWDYRPDYYGTCRIIPDEPLGGDFSGSTNEEVCWNYFISQGFSEAAAAGILGNIYVESAGTFDPSIHQFGGGPGRGLCQWEESYSGGSGRYNNLAAFALSLGKEWDDITAQLQFISYELDSGAMNPYFSKFGGVEAFKRSTDPTTATYVFLCGFEYCGDPGTSFLESNFALSTRVDHAGWAYLNYQ